MKTSFNCKHIVAIVAGLCCLLVYLKALTCGFVNFDDQDFVQNNQAIRQLDSNLISYAFTSVPGFSGLWSPLIWISYAIDYKLWGLNPLGYHLTNILLHAATTILVVLVADGLYQAAGDNKTRPGAESKSYLATLFLAGLLFGIHPLRVESVAWISERKDVLNGVFSMGAILFYLRHVQRMMCEGGRFRITTDYLISILLFICSMMAKPVSVVIPAMLLVTDWYPLKRLHVGTMRVMWLEKLPYIVLSVAMTVLSLYLGGQSGGLLVSSEVFSMSQRLVASGNSIFEYVRLILFPIGILPIHILPTPIPLGYTVKTAIVVLIGIYIGSTCRARWLLAGLLCFIFPLVPVLSFFQTNDVSVAARYTYLPGVAVSIVGAALLVAMHNKMAGMSRHYLRCLTTTLIFMLLVFYVVMTGRLIGVWKNSESLWTREITYQPFDKAYFLRALHYLSTGNYRAAVIDYTACLDIAYKEGLPEEYMINILAFRGEALLKDGQYEDAIRDFSQAINKSPQQIYFYQRGLAYKAAGRLKEAEEDFGRAGTVKGRILWL